MSRIKMVIAVALVAVMMAMGSMAFAGPSVAAAPADNTGCPQGWFIQVVPAGDPFDMNEDGLVCTKTIENPNGDGNSAKRPGALPFHADGHNHKDNNNPTPTPLS